MSLPNDGTSISLRRADYAISSGQLEALALEFNGFVVERLTAYPTEGDDDVILIEFGDFTWDDSVGQTHVQRAGLSVTDFSTAVSAYRLSTPPPSL